MEMHHSPAGQLQLEAWQTEHQARAMLDLHITGRRLDVSEQIHETHRIHTLSFASERGESTSAN
jgi:hypothetical protein